MSGYSSIWVKINYPDNDLLILHEQYNKNAILPEGFVFACAVKEADDEIPTESMLALSQQFGEAVFMYVQTVVDYFVYSHWCDGELRREIQYCAGEGWYVLDGETEDWERRLFNEEEKLRQLSYLDLNYLATRPDSTNEYADAQRTAAQIEAVWAAKELQQDSFYPMATASELYEIVMQAMRLAS